MLCRHRYYQSIGNARAYRQARSHAITYRTLNRRRRILYELARQDRAMWERLSQWGNRWHSVSDPIEAEVYRIRCELYCALATGADVEQAFQRHYERAKLACEQFNAKQATIKTDWRIGIAGHFSPESAWQQLRHAVRTYQKLASRSASERRRCRRLAAIEQS